jgi:Holliday junction resolvase
MTRMGRNRANGKRYEGEIVKTLRGRGIYARLGRSNEEGDIVIPDLNIILEVKSTSRKNFRMSLNRKTREQYYRLLKVPAQVFYAVRYKGNGLRDWKLHPLPRSVQVLYRDEGLTLDEFLISLEEHKEVSA